MADSNRNFILAILAVSLVAVGIFVQPTVEEKFAPEPEIAWVAIDCGSDGIADVGQVQRVVGEAACQLHAVLEARDRNDQPVYYTETKRLSFGGVEVDSDRLRTWRRGRWIKIRWFTVEGNRPYVRLNNDEGIRGFLLKEFLRSDWPLAWSIPADIDAAFDNHLSNESVLERQFFGTQRFHVRVEIYRMEDDLIPMRVVRSWGIGDLKEHVDAFPTLRLELPGRLAPISRVFGLTQLEAPVDADPQLLEQIDELSRYSIAYSKLRALRDQIGMAGRTLESLDWQSIDLSGTAPRGDTSAASNLPQPGDLLRVGDRIVILYDDQGLPGILDYDDWCFDLEQGVAARSLRDVFSGEGLDLEWASLAPAAPDAPQGPNNE